MENFIKSITLYPQNKTKQNKPQENQIKTTQTQTECLLYIGAVTEMLPNRMSKVITAYLLEIFHFLIVYSAFPEH